MSPVRTYHIVLGLVISLVTTVVHGQCANNNTAISGGAITPTCSGTTNVSCVQGGQYALVNVVAGNTYTFSTCGANYDTQITLYNNAGGGSLGYNDDACGLQSTVTWTATFTGQLRVLVDRYNCTNHNVCAPLVIQCSTPPPTPTGDCVYVLNMTDSWGDGWGSSYVSVSINGGPWQNYTVTGTTNSVSFGVNIGQVVSISYNASGTFQNENSYSLTLNGGPLYSSGSPPQSGVVYTGLVDCQPPPSPPQDCAGGTTICSGQTFNNTSNNTGAVTDLNSSNQGCLLSGEQQGTWYYFSPSTSGTIGFTIDPAANDDYDFAVWGPMSTVTCPPSGPPLRCSYASGFSTNQQTGSYNTGVGNGAADQTEGAGGNGWVAPINVTAGQIYILYVDNFSSTGQAFSLSWQLTNGASLDCTVLPIELISFDAMAIDAYVDLSWATASERNSDHFLVERSNDAEEFKVIGSLPAAGESSATLQYHYKDEDPIPGSNYYRLKQVDHDGSTFTSEIRNVIISKENEPFPNPTDGIIHLSIDPGPGGTISYSVNDMSGRVLLQGSEGVAPGSSIISIDLGSLANGQYVLEWTDAGGTGGSVTRVVKR